MGYIKKNRKVVLDKKNWFFVGKWQWEFCKGKKRNNWSCMWKLKRFLKIPAFCTLHPTFFTTVFCHLFFLRGKNWDKSTCLFFPFSVGQLFFPFLIFFWNLLQLVQYFDRSSILSFLIKVVCSKNAPLGQTTPAHNEAA